MDFPVHEFQCETNTGLYHKKGDKITNLGLGEDREKSEKEEALESSWVKKKELLNDFNCAQNRQPKDQFISYRSVLCLFKISFDEEFPYIKTQENLPLSNTQISTHPHSPDTTGKMKRHAKALKSKLFHLF